MAHFKISGCVVFAAALFMTQPGWSQTLELTSPLGTKFFSIPDQPGAIATAQKNLAADPKNVNLILKLAQAQAGAREYREAVETCTKGLKIAPQNADLYLERGHREVALREFAKARADLNKAASLDPKNPEVYYHLGLSHYFLGEFSLSADAFHHAVDLAPSMDSRINSSNWLYASLRRAKKNDEAAKALAAITPEMKNTEPHTAYYLHMIRFFQGTMKEADVVPPQPADANDVEGQLSFATVAYGVGNWFLYNGDTAKAQDYFRRVLTEKVWITWGFVGAETDLIRSGGAKN
jgi:tetratricopeptide (TPR) repeat protein